MKVRKQHLNIALFVLAAAVLWTAWGFVKPTARQTPPRGEPMLRSLDQPAPQIGAVDPATIPPPADIDTVRGPSWTRDPFLFGNESRIEHVDTPQVVTSNPLVRSILVSSTRRVALVDNRMVSVGESVGSFRVTEINPGSVVFVTATGERRQVLLHRPSPVGIKR